MDESTHERYHEVNTWFSADLHLGHDRIIRYCNRPFESVEQMNETILTQFNEKIKKGDMLYLLGDLAWSNYSLYEFFGRLNTKQVQLILGNHDNRRLAEYRKFCSWIGDYKSVTINKQSLILFHYPLRSWVSKGHGGIHLFGHCHGSLPNHDRSMDVGVDTNNFYPWELAEIQERFVDVPMFSDRDTENHNRGEVSNGKE